MNDTQIRDKWRAAGGSFHGPHVETGHMEESKLLPFLRGLLETIEDQKVALREFVHTAQRIEANRSEVPYYGESPELHYDLDLLKEAAQSAKTVLGMVPAPAHLP